MILEIDVHLVRFEEGRNCARLSLLDGAQQRQVLFACISHGPATAATGLCPACPEEAARAHSAQVSFERPEAPRRCDVKGTGKSLSCKRHGWWGRRGPTGVAGCSVAHPSALVLCSSRSHREKAKSWKSWLLSFLETFYGYTPNGAGTGCCEKGEPFSGKADCASKR